MKKKLLALIATIQLIIGGASSILGALYSNPYGGIIDGIPKIRAIQNIVAQIKEIYQHSTLYEQGDMLAFSSHGLLGILFAPGALLVLVAIIIFVVGRRKPQVQQAGTKTKIVMRRKKEDKNQDESDASSLHEDNNFYNVAPEKLNEKTGESTDFDLNISDTVDLKTTKKKQTFFIDEDLLSDSFDDKNIFYNIEKVVSMTQANVTSEQFHIILSTLRPEYLPFVDYFSEETKKRIARQILVHQVLRLKREEHGISPDQFSIQDKRMSETERETICRRFVPVNEDILTKDTVKTVGRVFVAQEQSAIQQSNLSNVEDWQDISLRNLVSVMTKEPPVLKAEK